MYKNKYLSGAKTEYMITNLNTLHELLFKNKIKRNSNKQVKKKNTKV